MDKQLRECPFCGTEPHISPRVGWWKAFCDQGNQDHICIVYGKTKREAIKKWNATRPPQNSGASVEEILKVMCKFGKPDYKDGGTNIHESDYIKVAKDIHAKLGAPQADKGKELEK